MNYDLNISLSKDHQHGVISRDQGRDVVHLESRDLMPLLADFANEPTRATLQRWFAKKRLSSSAERAA